ncbi:Site-specific DNA recombinase [Luteibacter sp. UNCMF331Sha3.1]|uniref:recombinase family protein n=1 Tax=Luteibacter sp. UNCMF331Sha3.1 TaxID=1502760 RepID=UPI0008BC6DCB|nr:recombinase family protein [Luteibacter sp. UNCMF331Sha3.1]SEM54313.1 Site-specific DNA recombinase [Luteibacter sp. UNCMF331Sha3.1]
MTKLSPPQSRASLMDVAQYLRMSTEKQIYSPVNQAAAIAQYARANGMKVVRTYSDEGRSGVRLEGRRALQRLLEDVQAGAAEFEAVLVLDVSRWGRFQNVDEAAFYEFLCLRHGVKVVYVAEPFAADSSPLSAMLKGLKRSMAGEYSRELSSKVFAGQCRLVKAGYRMGGPPGYGLRRQLVDAEGRPKAVLQPGERKSLMTDRIRIVLGPPDELRVVRWIFKQSAAGVSCNAITRKLNAKGILNQAGRKWSFNGTRELLDDERYIGTLVFGKTTKAIGRVNGSRSPDRELRVPDAFPALVTRELFNAAKLAREDRNRKPSAEAMLEGMELVKARHGRITSRLLDTSPETPTAQSYLRRFGSLREAYRQIGYSPVRDLDYGNIRDKVRPWRRSVLACVREMLEDDGAEVAEDGWILEVDGVWTIGVRLFQASHYHGKSRWELRPTRRSVDVIVGARMAVDGSVPLDYVVLPRVMADCWPQWVSDPPSPASNFFIFPSLGFLQHLSRISRHVSE